MTGGVAPRVSFTVTNGGMRAGSDVPQVYASVAGADGVSVQRLVGFERVTLRSGESRRVSVSLDLRLLARYDVTKPGWRIAPGAVPIMLGHNVETPTLNGMLDRLPRRVK